MPTWMNAGTAEFHGATVSIRRAYSTGLAFDFNYTLSHSIDNASAAEGGAGLDGAVIQNVFGPGQFRGSSDSTSGITSMRMSFMSCHLAAISGC